MSSRKVMGKKKGLSTWEKAGIPLIILIVTWVVYSFMQPSANIHPQTTSTTAILDSSSASDFTLPVIGPNRPTGDSLALSSLRGKVVLLEFMEPWCPHCQSMVPTLGLLHEKYPNLTMLSVAGPWNGATAGDLAHFEANYEFSWTYLFDSTGSIMTMYHVTATPTFFIIGRNGLIVTSLQGDQGYATLKDTVVQAMNT